MQLFLRADVGPQWGGRPPLGSPAHPLPSAHLEEELAAVAVVVLLRADGAQLLVAVEAVPGGSKAQAESSPRSTPQEESSKPPHNRRPWQGGPRGGGHTLGELSQRPRPLPCSTTLQSGGAGFKSLLGNRGPLSLSRPSLPRRGLQ